MRAVSALNSACPRVCAQRQLSRRSGRMGVDCCATVAETTSLSASHLCLPDTARTSAVGTGGRMPSAAASSPEVTVTDTVSPSFTLSRLCPGVTDAVSPAVTARPPARPWLISGRVEFADGWYRRPRSGVIGRHSPTLRAPGPKPAAAGVQPLTSALVDGGQVCREPARCRTDRQSGRIPQPATSIGRPTEIEDGHLNLCDVPAGRPATLTGHQLGCGGRPHST
jgi:hypothetical protein